MSDYYDILGIKRDATHEEINKAYRAAALQYHPDRNPDSADKFKEITSAYEVLGDPEKRAQYDRRGTMHFSHRSGLDDVGDIISRFFRDDGGFNRSSVRGTRVRLQVTLQEAFKGTVKKVDVHQKDPCSSCKASGATKWQHCRTCGGVGYSIQEQGNFSIQIACGSCQGRGQLPAEQCKTCSGHGYVKGKTRNVSVDVPAGVEDSTQIRFAGQGVMGEDLYVVVSVEEHKQFQREGRNLFCEVSVSYTQLALGDTIKFQGVDGKELDLKIRPGVNLNSRLRLKGQGMPLVQNPSFRGDLYVSLNLIVPVKFSKEHRALLDKLAKIEKKNSV